MYKNIKRLCEEKNISIHKMCKDLGISSQSITNLKNRSKTNPLAAVSLTSAVKIAEYLGVTIDELMRGVNQCTKDIEQKRSKKLIRKWTEEEYITRIKQHVASTKDKDIMEWSVADLIEHEKIVTQTGILNEEPEFMTAVHVSALATLEKMINVYGKTREI